MKSDLGNRLDNYFREGLDDLRVIPPADVWENIAGNLPVKKKNRKMFLWIVAAASISLFAAVSGWLFLQNDNTTKNNTQLTVQQKAKPALNQSQLSIENGNQAVKEKNIANTKIDNSNKLYSEAEPKINSVIEERIANNTDKLKENESVESSLEKRIPQKTNVALVTEKTSTEIKEFSTQTHHFDQLAFLQGKQLKLFDLPVLERTLVFQKSEIIKKDTTPVYDNIFIADDDAAEQSKSDRWDIGGQMAPLYSYRNVTEVNAPGISKASIDQVEKAMMTYSSGVVVGYNASSRLSIHTGVYYMKMGEEIDNISTSSSSIKSFIEMNSGSAGVYNSTGKIIIPQNEVYDIQLVNSKSEYAVGKVAYQPLSRGYNNVQQTFEFLEVPFLAKYKVIDRKFGIHLLGGLSTHVLVNNKTTIINSDNSKTIGKTENVETFNYSSSVGFGMVYKVRNNMTFSVEPTFKYYLNSFNTSNDIRLHPYALGLYSGIFFKF